jgi:hypothetical protein
MALCDTFLWLATENVYSLRWSAHVLEEVRRNLVARNLCSPDRADWRVGVMRDYFEDAEISGYERLIESQTQCGDKNDRHVVAAAIVGGVDQIVTNNLSDFPAVIEPSGIDVVSPDEFLLNALDIYPKATIRALNNQVANLMRPPLSVSQVLASLARCGVPRFACEVAATIDRISSGP